MQIVKTAVSIGAVLALTGTFVFAAQYKVKISGTIYSSDGTQITATKFSNKELISTNKGATVVWDDSAGLILTVDKTGGALSTNIIFIAPYSCMGNAVKGSLTERVCTIPIQIGEGSSYGGLIIDVKTLVTTKGTNMTGKASGLFNNDAGNQPGAMSLTFSGAFKPSTK
jgi:hypothetical protein